MREWIRAKDLPAVYGISRSHAYKLLTAFTAETNPEDYIRDGRVLIVKQKSFEDWWRNKK